MKRISRVVSSFVFVAAAAGCAAPQVAHLPASAPEKEAATIAYMNCLIPHAKRLDDGRSDAKTIAQAMRGACRPEVEAVYETISRGENDAVKRGIWQGMASIEESSALQVVLNTRNANSK